MTARRFVTTWVALLMLVVTASVARAIDTAAAAAAKASPELVGALSSELNATPEQSAGAAGALFGVAKSKMKPADFSQVTKAVPGMNLLLAAAPALDTGKAGNPLSQLAGAASALGPAAAAFQKLGLKPELVAKAIPVLTSFVSKTGGSNVATLLASVLK